MVDYTSSNGNKIQDITLRFHKISKIIYENLHFSRQIKSFLYHIHDTYCIWWCIKYSPFPISTANIKKEKQTDKWQWSML